MTVGIPMSIGNLRLIGAGVPDEVVLGGSQRLAIHELPGGGRTIDVMGAQDENLTWSGVLIGPDAVARAEAIDALRRSGNVQAIGFGSYSINAVIERFNYAYALGGAFVRYQIRCQTTNVTGATASNTAVVALVAGLTLGASVLDGISGDQAAAVAGSLSGLAGVGVSRSYTTNDLLTAETLTPALSSLEETANSQIASLVTRNGDSLPALASDVAIALQASGMLAASRIAGGVTGQATLLLQQSLGL